MSHNDNDNRLALRVAARFNKQAAADKRKRLVSSLERLGKRLKKSAEQLKKAADREKQKQLRGTLRKEVGEAIKAAESFLAESKPMTSQQKTQTEWFKDFLDKVKKRFSDLQAVKETLQGSYFPKLVGETSTLALHAKNILRTWDE